MEEDSIFKYAFLRFKDENCDYIRIGYVDLPEDEYNELVEQGHYDYYNKDDELKFVLCTDLDELIDKLNDYDESIKIIFDNNMSEEDKKYILEGRL